MKRYFSIFFLSAAAFFLVQSCASSRLEEVVDADYTDNNDSDEIKNAAYITNLSDLLRRKHNVIITGSGRSAQATIRGIQSINDTSLPLYYVNNVRVGRNLAQVSNTVNPNQVKRIEVIGGLSELASYGHDGRNGVIKIFTEKS